MWSTSPRQQSYNYTLCKTSGNGLIGGWATGMGLFWGWAIGMGLFWGWAIGNELILRVGHREWSYIEGGPQVMSLYYWRWATGSKLTYIEVGHREWAYTEGGPRGIGLFWGIGNGLIWGWATGNGLILRVGQRKWAYIEGGGNYSISLASPASHSPTPDHSCPLQMHEGHPNPSSVPPERREETHSHPW